MKTPNLSFSGRASEAWIVTVQKSSALLILLVAFNAGGLTRYVDLNCANPTPPYTNWVTAGTKIQDVVDAALPGDDVLVTNGLYAIGGRSVGTNRLVNRVAVDKPLTVLSVNGPEFTIIQGHQVPLTTNGDGAIRCVYLADGARLSGFTLTNGATLGEGSPSDDQNGGGIYCASDTAVVSNCVVVSCSASAWGGGTFSGTHNNCWLKGNVGFFGGGSMSGHTQQLRADWQFR